MLKAKSLYHLIVYSILFIILVISSFTFVIINNAHEELQEKVETLKEDYTNNQKALLKNHVDYVIKFIEYYHNNSNFKNISEDSLKKDVISAVEQLKLSTDPNEYIFIYDFDGNLLLSSHENQGNQNFLNFQDKKGKFAVKELIENSKNPNGGFVDYFWTKPEINKETNKLSFVNSYTPWEWTIGKGVYLDEIDKLINDKEDEYNKKISNYTLLITSLTILLILYSIFIYKNATILIVNDVKEIGNYLKESQEQGDNTLNQNRFMFGEFKVIANYANDAMTNIKLKTLMLEELNKNLEFKVNEKTKELSALVDSQKQFIKTSVHEVNTPLAIIRTNIDLLKMKTPDNSYITNIESGAKMIQYIYDDLSYLIKKDRVIYEKEYLNFTEILNSRLNFFEQIVKANSLYFVKNIENDAYIKFNPIELQRVIDNNLSNAIKYSIVSSPIFIKLIYLNDDEIEFSVATKSKKIDKPEKIFEDFYRENDARGGFGLGLKIVKEICDKNFVIIDINSNEKDTKFIYRFKVNEDTTSWRWDDVK